MRAKRVGLPLEASLSWQAQDKHLPRQQGTLKLSLEIDLHNEFQFLKFFFLRWLRKSYMSWHWSQRQLSENSVDPKGNLALNECPIYPTPNKARTHSQACLVLYYGKFCLWLNHASLGFLPITSWQSLTYLWIHLIGLAEVAHHLFFCAQPNVCILQDLITAPLLQHITP